MKGGDDNDNLVYLSPTLRELVEMEKFYHEPGTLVTSKKKKETMKTY